MTIDTKALEVAKEVLANNPDPTSHVVILAREVIRAKEENDKLTTIIYSKRI